MDGAPEGVGAGQELETPGWEESVPAPSRRLHNCHHCGRICGDYEGGYATLNSFPVCHPNVEGRPDCYHLVTLGHHNMPCLECSQLELPLTEDEVRLHANPQLAAEIEYAMELPELLVRRGRPRRKKEEK